MKRILALSALFLSVSCFSSTFPTYCDPAPPVTDSKFCAAFKASAQCHCQADGKLPEGMCLDMNVVYSRMIGKFHTQQEACDWQKMHGVPVTTESQECMDDWDCYRLGGDHHGLCSGTGNKCP